MTVNLAMSRIVVVNANGTGINTIYAGEKIYFRADFTTENLPSNGSYRVRYVTDVATDTTDDSPYLKDGDGDFFDDIESFSETSSAFYALGGNETVTVTVNPDRSVTESNSDGTDPYADNTISLSFYAVLPASKVVITSQPTSPVVAGVPFYLTADVEDMNGYVVANDNTSVLTVALVNPDGDKLNGTLTATASDGIASFNGLSLDTAKVYTLRVSDNPDGLTPATSNPLTVVAAAASQLAILTEPTANVAAGTPFGLTVMVQDQYGNQEMGDKSTQVTASLATGSGPLQGTTTVTDANGIAIFTNLIDDTLETLTLDLSSGILTPVISSNVAVTPGMATKLVVQSEPSSTGTVGQPFAVQPVIEEEDRFGHVETGDNSTVVTALLASGTGTLQGVTATVSGGVATFANLADSKAESMSLKFISGGLNSATSNKVVVGKATPVITWPTPVPVATGAPLGAATLDATASNFGVNVPGTFAYSSAVGLVTSSAVLALGSHTLHVTFTPTDSSDYNSPTPLATTINIQPGTTTSLAVSAAVVTYKHPITFTALVTSPTVGVTPTGSVTFLDGSTVLGISKVDGTGHAKFTTTSLPSGTPSITASYSGDSTNTASTSPATTLHIHESVGGDFDGDGRADVAIYDQTAAVFYITDSSTGVTQTVPFGNPSHVNIAVPGDYDGDGKTDLAIYDQTAAVFIIAESGGASLMVPFGNQTHVNIPVAGDFDGDGKTDLAVYDQTAAVFIVAESGGASIFTRFGNPAHVNIPIAGDFDGDGKTDLAVYDQTAAVMIVAETGGASIFTRFGNPADVNIPLAGDFDGDGKTDLAVFDQTASVMIVAESGGGSIFERFGNPADVNVPIMGDFDGDGETDVAVFDQTASVLIVAESGGGSLFVPFGNKKHTNLPV